VSVSISSFLSYTSQKRLAFIGLLQWAWLSRNEQEEGRINRLGIALTARPTGGLAVYPDRIVVTTEVSGVAPGVFGAGRQSVDLKPSAPAVNCLHILPEIDLIHPCR